MKKVGFSVFRLCFIVFFFISLALIIIEQRLEAKEYDIKLKNLQKEIEKIEFQKKELSLKINQEQSRIASYHYQEGVRPISMSDIIPVKVSHSRPQEIPTDRYTNSIDMLLSLVFGSAKPSTEY